VMLMQLMLLRFSAVDACADVAAAFQHLRMEYEKARLERIKQNEAKMKELVSSPTDLVTNVEQSEGPEKEIVDDTTHETEEEIGEGVTRTTRGITCGKGA
ncbi:hypothetical protein M8C21_032176, partial [Ambrosia artemisiifolia]